jgi:membrane protein required for colicin V production
MIDILFALFMLTAIIKGYRKGLIIALFSLIALIVGLTAALKLSAATAVYLQQQTSIPSKWLPVAAFLLVFLVVVALVKIGGKLLEQTAELAMLGWANKLGGILLYMLLYTTIYSILLFYAEKMSLIKPETLDQSASYAFVKPWGPMLMDGLGNILPIFKDTYRELNLFFEKAAQKI